MKTKNSSLALLLILLVQGCADRSAHEAVPPAAAKTKSDLAAAKTAWPPASPDLKTDPSVVWGRLSNGLRYAIVPTREAPGRASLQFRMEVGSVMESDTEQGMAHFLEHLAFRGTKHSPNGETFEYFQRLGLSFAAHANALTTFDSTTFRLDLPRANEEMAGEGLQFFRDVLDGMLLREADIERERGVILSELAARNSSDYRALVAGLRFTLPGLKVARRMPIGLSDRLKAMHHEQIVEFYEKWYTPGRAVLVAAGDFDVKMVARLIEKNFQDAVARRGEQADPDLGKLDLPEQIVAKLHADPDADGTSVVFNSIYPSTAEADTLAGQRDELIGILSDIMLNRRLQKLAAGSDAPILRGGVTCECICNTAELVSLSAACQPGKWAAGVATLEQELRRAMQFGFTDGEFAEAVTLARKNAQAFSEQAATRTPRDLAEGLLSTVAAQRVFTHPDDDRALVEKLLPGISAHDCVEMLKSTWQVPSLRIRVEGNVQIEGDAGEAILAAYRQSQAQTVAPPSEQAVEQFAYTDFGPAGTVAKREEHADLGIVSATFANNVHVNIKRTSEEKNVVRIAVRFGGGLLETPPEQPGLAILATGTFITGGLQAHNLTEINRLLLAKNAVVRFGIDEDAFLLSGGCGSDALATELQLCAAYLTAPGYRSEALSKFQGNLDAVYAQVEHSPEGAAQNGAYSFLHGGDRRFRLPAQKDMRRLTMDDLKNWLSPALQKGYLELGIVGDIDPDAALAIVAKTLGALPKREAQKPAFAAARKLVFPQGQEQDVPFVADQSQALLFVAWPLPGERSFARDRRLSILGDVLNDRIRVKIRNELGATYTPSVELSSGKAFTNFGYLSAVLMVEPQRLAEIRKFVQAIATDLSSGSITDDEFQRAIKPVLASTSELGNAYWLCVTDCCQEFPEELAAARNRAKDYASITKSEIEALAKTCLQSELTTVVNVRPQPPVKEAALPAASAETASR